MTKPKPYDCSVCGIVLHGTKKERFMRPLCLSCYRATLIWAGTKARMEMEAALKASEHDNSPAGSTKAAPPPVGDT